MLFGRTLHPEYTDMAFVMGPDTRWTEEDYLDLQRFAPEVLLGYRVRLCTPDTVRDGRLRGYRGYKLVLLAGVHQNSHWGWVSREVDYLVMSSYFPKVEIYDVHRGLAPVVRKVDYVQDQRRP